MPDRVRWADRPEFAAKFVKERKYPYVIAVDAGLAVCEDLGLVPDLAVGILTPLVWSGWRSKGRRKAGQRMSTNRKRMRRTQTSQSAPLSAPSFRTAHVLGATGGRLDHELSNIHLMRAAKDAGLLWRSMMQRTGSFS